MKTNLCVTSPITNRVFDAALGRARRWAVRGALLAIGVLIVAGCATTIPRDALKLSADSLARRQLQTRKFAGIAERDMLAASAGVLQDLGFNIDESETKLGVIVASKQRSAVETQQVVASVVIALLTGSMSPYDKTQKIRVSLVTHPVPATDDRDHLVRVTFQRMVWNTRKEITHIEAVDEPAIYSEFFTRLSKSVFLEAQNI